MGTHAPKDIDAASTSAEPSKAVATPHNPASEPVLSAKERFKQANSERLAALSSNPAFVGGDDENTVAAPANHVVMIDGYKVSVPDLSEAKIESDIYQDQLNYLLGSLEPALLDGMMNEYHHEFGTLLNEMGLKPQCENSFCGIQINAGAFLERLKSEGFIAGDLILSLNGTPLSTITDYDNFKKVLFNHANQLEFGVARKGEIIMINVSVAVRPAA